MKCRMSWLNRRSGGKLFSEEQDNGKNMMKNAEKGSCEEIEAKKCVLFYKNQIFCLRYYKK